MRVPSAWTWTPIAVLLTALIPRQAAAATNFDVTASGMSSYQIGGVNDPELTLTRGQTYTFNVIAQNHPFWITRVGGDATQAEPNAFPGVTNNGFSPGLVTFAVPLSAPSTLFYQCGFHDAMGAKLNIIGPTAPAPSVGPVALVALGGLLAAAALALLRRRRAA